MAIIASYGCVRLFRTQQLNMCPIWFNISLAAHNSACNINKMCHMDFVDFEQRTCDISVCTWIVGLCTGVVTSPYQLR